MGSYKVKGRGWRYHFQHEGKRYSRGFFPTRHLADAQEAEHRKEVEKQSQMDSTPAATGFKEAAYEYLDLVKRSQSLKTYKEKVFVYKSFQEHIVAQASLPADLDFPLPDIDARLFESYLKTRPTNANWNKHRKNLCALFHWCFKRGLLDRNPCLYVDNLAADLRQKTIYTQEEMVKLLLASGELRPFLFALYALAARVGELNRLRWGDVNFARREVILWTKKGGGSWREQKKHMNHDLYGELKRLYGNGKEAGVYVFPNPDTGLPFVDRRKQLKRICRAAGVSYLGWHAIRHHVASLLADDKESLPTIKKILGHRRLTTTEKYVQSLSQDVRTAAEKLKLHNAPAQQKEKGVEPNSPTP